MNKIRIIGVSGGAQVPLDHTFIIEKLLDF